MNSATSWLRFNEYYLRIPSTGVAVDISRMAFPAGFFASMQDRAKAALKEMEDLEKGSIANADENRMVGHYWLRNPSLAPDAALSSAITETNARITRFARDVHDGKIRPEKAERFTDFLVVGIGGSALGPQFVADALRTPSDPLAVHFLDNTDPDGFDRTFATLGERLASTLVLVISKSGGTKETRNGMLEAKAAFERHGLTFSKHAVAVTGEGSELDKFAQAEGWIERFPMWDWVGGRTSVMSAVGLLPMALQGFAIEDFLKGAAAMDEHTREKQPLRNAAMLLALMWYHAGDGRGAKDMVILPYKDRLMLLSKYLQQLVMESLGKELDRNGMRVNQGIAVYGNKGSTDQHAYVQQLRDGVNNFFATFLEVRAAREENVAFEVEPGITSGDYLQGFLRGTRAALSENNRESITLTLERVSAFHVGAIIALFERAVGFYASLVNINAYHQPGVEAGKKAATRVLELQKRIIRLLEDKRGSSITAQQAAEACSADIEDAYHVLCHLAGTRPAVQHTVADSPAADTFGMA
jgi:glucose-6-phosphate isomerase